MKCFTILALALALLAGSASSQTFEKITFNDKDPEDYYIQLKLPAEPVNGVLILLPGYAESFKPTRT